MVGEEKDKQPYGYEVYEEYNWKSLAKKIAKYAVIVLVIGAICWLLYDYFAGSYVPVEIQVKSLDTKPVNENSVSITQESSGVVSFEKSGQPSYNFTLKRGLFLAPENYVMTVEADGFKSATVSIKAGTEKITEIVKLEKDIDIKIKEISMPKQLFGGQAFTITATLENEGELGEEIEFGYGGELEEWNCTAADAEIYIAAGSIADFNIGCAVPQNAASQVSPKGVEKEAVVSIKMIKEEKTVKFTLYPKPSVTILKSLDFSGIDPTVGAKSKKRLDFTIKNGSKFALYGVHLSIEINSAKENDKGEVLKWISFVNSTEEDKTVLSIPVIDAGKTQSEPVEIQIPQSAIAEKITASIVTEAPFLEAPVNSILSIDIIKSAQASIKLDYDSPMSIGFSGSSPESKIETMDVKNTGDLDISNLSIEVKNRETCTENWLYFTDSDFIQKIKAKESKAISITVSAPPLAAAGASAPCILQAVYPHPLTNAMVEEDQGVLVITRSK
ncbi:MAG: hypothetical protein NT067_04300 [Candidatus Diapherotrites archaeon]|nr:hypothetical protein [Candidatus Diapherotrites archaeon]